MLYERDQRLHSLRRLNPRQWSRMRVIVKVTKIASGQPMAQRDKRRPTFFRREVRRREVRLRLLYFAANALESFERILAEVQKARFHRKVAAESFPSIPRCSP